MIPILAFDWLLVVPTKLNLSLLQFVCSEACGPIRDFHLLWPSETARYVPLAISAYSELALWRMTTNLVLSRSPFQDKSLKSSSPNKREFGFLFVKTSLSSCKVVNFLVAPERRGLVGGVL